MSNSNFNKISSDLTEFLDHPYHKEKLKSKDDFVKEYEILKLQASIKELEPSNETFQASTEELKPSNETLQANTEELEPSNEILQANTEEFEPSNETLKASTEELKPFNETLQANTEVLESSNETLKASTEELKPSNETLKASTEELKPFNETLQANTEVLESSNETVKTNVEFKSEDDYQKYLDDYHKKLFKSETFITRKLKDVISLFYISILSGEFISEKDFETKLELIQALIGDSSIEKLTEDVESDILTKIIDFKNSIDYLIDTYRSFYFKIKSEFSNENKFDLIYTDYQNIPTKNNSNTDINELFKILKLLIEVTYLDVSLKSTYKELISLLDLKSRLSIYKEDKYPITKVINLKLDFLIEKWIKRRQNIQKKKALKVTINGDLKELESYKNNPEQYSFILKKWLDKIEYHYELSEDYNDGIKHSIKHVNPENLKTFFDLHSYIKFFKDVKKKSNKLNELINNPSNELKISDNFYNNYVEGINSNYLKNNYFSSYCGNEKDIEKLLEKYEDIESDLVPYIDNYFLEFKLLETIFNILLKELDNNRKLDIGYYKNLVDKLEPILDKYYSKKEWAKTKNNFIYGLSFEESKIDVKQLGVPNVDEVFFFSSFVLPIDYDSLDYQYSQVRQKFRNIKNIVDVLNTLNDDLESVKTLKTDFNTKISTLNEDLEKKDFKSIEIISLFTAIITFILSSIPAFKFIENIQGALLFILALGGGLSMFIIAIFYFTSNSLKNGRNNDSNNRVSNKLNIGIGILVITTIISSLILIKCKDPIDTIIDRQYKNDKEKLIIDSIKTKFIKESYSEINKKDSVKKMTIHKDSIRFNSKTSPKSSSK